MIPAKGNDKWYRPLNQKPTSNHIHLSSPHKVKGFADDISIISSSVNDHGAALQVISTYCSDLGLVLNPSKCISLVYNGRVVDKRTVFSVGSGKSRNISSGPTKFLGHLLGHSNSITITESGKRFTELFQMSLNSLDSATIRGEYKLWVYKRFLVPSFHFLLAVDAIPGCALKKMEALATKKSRDGSAYL